MLIVNEKIINEKIDNMSITRQEVLGLNEAMGRLPRDIKDFEYQYCVIENSERLSAAVNKIKEALKAAASDEFLTQSKELAESASKIMGKEKIEWSDAMEKAFTALPKKARDAYNEMQKVQAALEAEYLGKESDIELYKIAKDDLPKPFPLDQYQTIAFKYFIK